MDRLWPTIRYNFHICNHNYPGEFTPNCTQHCCCGRDRDERKEPLIIFITNQKRYQPKTLIERVIKLVAASAYLLDNLEGEWLRTRPGVVEA